MAKSPAWTRKEGKNPEGGLNAKGRASAKAQGMNLKRPQPEGGSRRDSFCARMSGMKKKLTSAKTANDPALLMFWVKASHDEVKRLSILLSKTREENAEKYVTKSDVHNDIDRVLARLDRLESKIDDFMKEQRSALG